MARFQPQQKKKVGTPAQTKTKEEKKVLFEEVGDDDDDDDDEDDDDDSVGENDDEISDAGLDEDDDDEDDEDDDDDDDDEDDDEDDDDDNDETLQIAMKSPLKQQKTPTGQMKSPGGKLALIAQTPGGKTPKGNKQTPKNNQADKLPAVTPNSQKKGKKGTPEAQLSGKKQKNAGMLQGGEVQDKAVKKQILKRFADDLPPQNKKPKLENVAELKPEMERIQARDRRTLFVKGFLADATNEDIKGLSSDILDIRRNKKTQTFAFLEFQSEEIAEKNHAILQSKTVNGKKLLVDYVGDKSKNVKPASKRPDMPIQKNKLYIGGLPSETQVQDLKKAFPKATSCVIPGSSKKRLSSFGFVTFANNEDAAEAHNNASSTVINGKLVVVLYAREARHSPNKPKQKVSPKPKSKNKKQAKPQQAPKKAKVEVADDDDDDDDDDDVDDSDEEMEESE